MKTKKMVFIENPKIIKVPSNECMECNNVLGDRIDEDELLERRLCKNCIDFEKRFKDSVCDCGNILVNAAVLNRECEECGLKW